MICQHEHPVLITFSLSLFVCFKSLKWADYISCTVFLGDKLMPLGSLLLLFFLAELTEKLWEEKVLSSHTKEKGHKSRETLNISKVASRWSHCRETIPWKENFLRNLISVSSACVFLILKRDASCHHQGQQGYCTVELAMVQAEAASISLKWALLSVGRPFHHSLLSKTLGQKQVFCLHFRQACVCSKNI